MERVRAKDSKILLATGLLVGMKGWYSKRCKLTWKLKGTKYNRIYFQLQVSTLRTKETEFGLLPTPRAMTVESKAPKIVNGQSVRPNGERFGANLHELAVSGLLPTPRMNEYKGGVTPEKLKEKGRKPTNSLSDTINDLTGKTSQLNPRFVLEMMGFPPDWTEKPFKIYSKVNQGSHGYHSQNGDQKA